MGLLDDIKIALEQDHAARERLVIDIKHTQEKSRLSTQEKNQRSRIIKEYEELTPKIVNAEIDLINAQISRVERATRTAASTALYEPTVRRSIEATEATAVEALQKQFLLNRHHIEQQSLMRKELAQRTSLSDNAFSFLKQQQCEFKKIIDSTDAGWIVPPHASGDSVDDCDVPSPIKKSPTL